MTNRTKLIILTALLLVVSAIGVYLYISQAQNDSLLKSSDTKTKTSSSHSDENYSYSVVDTGQTLCFDNSTSISCPAESQKFYGQDAQYNYVPFSYTDNQDGTVVDNNTGLVWQQSADLNGDGEIDGEDKKNQSEAESYCKSLDLAGHDDWILPSIKALYSLMNFSGSDTSGISDINASPFISTEYFDFVYGLAEEGERQVDSQWATSTIYVAEIMNRNQGMFGLNLADGRIKSYPVDKLFYVKCVRSYQEYGNNNFTDNGDETVTDNATGLTWWKQDSGETVIWSEALESCENSTLAGYEDWRLPNAKELQSIVDYSRSPDTTDSPAIDSIFKSTSFTDEMDEKDWGFYWTSTTHKKSDGSGYYGVYISFGRALGYMNNQWMDVHGAGAQRSDPKIGDPDDFETGFGPQGDVRRIYNYYRCVRGNSGTYNGEVPEPSNSSTSYDFLGQTWSTQVDQHSNSDLNRNTQSPPAEAVESCLDLNLGSDCSFTSQQGVVTGTCRVVQDELACVPNN